MLSLNQFLRHVLPADGYKVAVGIKNKRAFPSFFETFEDLEACLRGIDATRADAYFACSSYKERTRRKQENVKLIKSLWLDIDAGPGKSYREADAAFQAADDFITRTNLPAPTVVYSGNGLHLWWTLETPILLQDWHPLARTLKKLAVTHGLDADPTRTADAASILRPPQTFNWKNPDQPKEVYCEFVEPAVENSTFIQALSQFGVSAGLQPKTAPVGEVPFAGMDQSRFNVDVSKNFEPSAGAIVGRHCKQLGAMRDTLGVVSEPVWYACLGVLAHCVDGEQLSQEWSAGHSGYSAVATSQKLQHAKTAAGPTTCARFQAINPDGCRGCPHAITSPIQLGYVQVVTPPVIPNEEAIDAILPDNFKWGKNKELLAQIRTKDPLDDSNWNTEELMLSKHPVYLSAVKQNTLTGQTTYDFRHRTPHTEWQTFSITAKDMNSTSWRSTLSDFGVNLQSAGAKYFKLYTEAAVDKLNATNKPMPTFSSYGWKNDDKDFLLGTKLFTHDGKIMQVSGHGDIEDRSRYLRPMTTATIDGWRRVATKLFMPGCEGQALALLASFSAPLAPLAFSSNEGGAILSLVCPQGGSGKTTALTALTSVWGDIRGLNLNAGDTENSKTRLWGALHHLPPVYDELHEQDPKILGNLIRRYTVGEDRKRLDRNGALIKTESAWQTFMITASNVSLMDTLRAATGDPQSDRIFEVELPKPAAGAFSLTNELSKEFHANSGIAGPAFVMHMVKPAVKLWLSERIKSNISTYGQIGGAKLATNYRYVVRMFACMEAAATLLVKINMLEFDVERVMQTALNILQNRVTDNYTAFTPEIAIDQYIAANVRNILIVDGPYRGPTQPNITPYGMPQEIKGRYEVSTGMLYLSNDPLRRHLVQARCNYVTACRIFEEKRILMNRSHLCQLTAGTSMPSVKTSCWKMDMNSGLVDGVLPAVGSNIISLVGKPGEQAFRAGLPPRAS